MAERIERHIDLDTTPQQLWHQITDADALSGWLAEEVHLELKVGGEANFREGEERWSGWVEEILPPPRDGRLLPGELARLAFWWTTAEEPAARVELTLLPLGDGRTRLRVVETRPLERLDLVGTPLPGTAGRTWGPALIAA